MKKAGKIITAAVTAVAVVGVSLGVHFGYSNKKFEQNEYKVNTDGKPLSVAVISDLHCLTARLRILTNTPLLKKL